MERINKAQARKAYGDGTTVYIIPCKMRIDGEWVKPHPINNCKMSWNFDCFVNEFEYYNCNSEQGRYAAFYIE